MEKTNEIKRSDTWNEIYKIVKTLPRKNVKGDAPDASSVTTSIDQLFLKLLTEPVVSVTLLEQVKIKFSQINDDERMEVMSDYCDHCGCSEKNSRCYCAPRYDI